MVGKQTTGTPPMNGGHDHTDVGIASMRETNPSTPLTPSKDDCGDGTDSAAVSTATFVTSASGDSFKDARGTEKKEQATACRPWIPSLIEVTNLI